jgi:hypothetical protein
MNKLEYGYQKSGEPVVASTTFRIGASQVHKFSHQTSLWYRKNILGEPQEHETATVLGTSIHYLAEQFTKNGRISDEDRTEIYDYITLKRSETVDEQEIRAQLTPMWKKLRGHLELNPIQLSEISAINSLPNGFIFGGTIDGIRTLDGSTPTSLEELQGKTVELVDF